MTQPKGLIGRSQYCSENSIKVKTGSICRFRPLNKSLTPSPLPYGTKAPAPISVSHTHSHTLQIQQPAHTENTTLIWFSDLQQCFPFPGAVFLSPRSSSLWTDIHKTLINQLRGWGEPGSVNCFWSRKEFCLIPASMLHRPPLRSTGFIF